MARGEIKTCDVEIKKAYLEDVFIGLGKSASPFLYTPLPENPALSDLFKSFPEGSSGEIGESELMNSWDKHRRDFAIQTRFSGGYMGRMGRIGIRYEFETENAEDGLVRFWVSDNGDDVPQKRFDEVYSSLRKYIVGKNLRIIKETKDEI
jgi:hypothetical protein